MKKLTFICLIAFTALFSASAANIYQKIMQPFMNGPTKNLFKVYHTIFKICVFQNFVFAVSFSSIFAASSIAAVFPFILFSSAQCSNF